MSRIFPILQTERLRLRPMTLDDAPAIQQIFSHPEVMRYKGMSTFPDLERAQSWLTWVIGLYDAGTLRWGITLEGVVIGTIGLREWDDEIRCAKLGYDLAFEHWNKGIMTEALTAVVHYGFHQADLNRIEAEVVVGNHASERVLTKLGFQKEGILRDKDIKDGHFLDMWLFSLLRREWGNVDIK